MKIANDIKTAIQSAANNMNYGLHTPQVPRATSHHSWRMHLGDYIMYAARLADSRNGHILFYHERWTSRVTTLPTYHKTVLSADFNGTIVKGTGQLSSGKHVIAVMVGQDYWPANFDGSHDGDKMLVIPQGKVELRGELVNATTITMIDACGTFLSVEQRLPQGICNVSDV